MKKSVIKIILTLLLFVEYSNAQIVTQTFNYTGSIQSFTVPAGVTSITIQAKGGEGGSSNSQGKVGGLGANTTSTFNVTPGNTLQIVVGGRGENGQGSDTSWASAGGGGGGSFVTIGAGFANFSSPLIVAGGGGGGFSGRLGTDLTNIPTNGGAGGLSLGGTGDGGISAGQQYGGAGAGILTNGQTGGTCTPNNTGGKSIISGGLGGNNGACLGSINTIAGKGGFGGGGGANWASGGGGGYSGGNAGNANSTTGSVGGTSYIDPSALSSSNIAGVNSGNGQVTITYTLCITPIVSCPANITVSNTTGQCVANVTYPAATATGSPTPTITYSQNSGTSFPVGTTTVTATATNTCGSHSCTFTVTVNDTQPPTITCPSNITASSTPGQCGAAVSFDLPPQPPTVDQSCDQIYTGTVGGDQWQSFTAGQSGLLTGIDLFHNGCQNTNFTMTIYTGTGTSGTVLYSGATNFGNFCSSWFNVAIPSGSQPTVTAGQTYTFRIQGIGTGFVAGNTSCYSSGSYYSSDYGLNPGWKLNFKTYVSVVSPSASATDNCGVASLTSNYQSGDVFPVGITTVTYTATDTSGNTSNCSFTVTVNDTQGPVITCPANITVSTDPGQCNALIAFPSTLVLQYNPTGPQVSTTAVAPSFQAANYTAGNLSQVGSNNPWTNTNVWPVGQISSSPTPVAGEYLTFQVTVPNGTDLARLQYSKQAYLGGGATLASIRSSLDGFTSDISVIPVTPIGVEELSFDLSAVPFVSGTVTFRIYFYGSPNNKTDWDDLVSTNNGGNGLRLYANNLATATDNCGPVTISYTNFPSNYLFNKGVTTITATATDAAGNTDTCSFTVTVNDTELPVITCPGTLTVNANNAGCTYTGSIGTATAIDNCGSPAISGPVPAGPYPVGTTVVTWTATDASGNFATCTQSVTVVNSAPTVTANNVSGCFGTPISLSGTPAGGTWSIANPYTGPNTTYTHSYTDGNGCSATSASATVTTHKLDYTNLQWPPNQAICPGGSFTTYGQVYEGGLTDISPHIVGQAPGIQAWVGISPVGSNSNPNTWSNWTPAVWNSGFVNNNDEYMATIGSSLAPGTYYYTFRYSYNGCAYQYGGYGGSGVWDGSSSISGVLTVKALDYVNLQWPGSESICPGGSITAYGQVYEGGLTDFGVNIPNQAPGIQAWIGISPVGSNSNPNTWSNWTLATWNTGHVSNNDEYMATFGSSLAPGTYYYTFRYSLDGCAYQYGGFNANGSSFWDGVNYVSGVLTISDNQPPAITCPANIVVSNALGQCNANVSFAATAIDNCGTATLSYSPASGSLFNVGTTTVTATANDGNGNTALCTFTVTVNDTEAPVITCPSNISSSSNLGCGTAVAVGVATAIDNCSVDHIDGVRSDTLALTDLYPIGQTTISWTATDIHGNVSDTCIQTITVTGQQAIASPASQTICSGSPVVTIVLSGSVSGTSYLWARDNASVTGIATNGSGNISGSLTNTTDTPITVTFTITPTLNGCLGTAITSTVTVDPTTDGGVVTGGTSICPGQTSSLLTLSGNVGNVVYWESAIAPFLSWDPISNSSATYTSGSLAETTQFRAVVLSGTCLLAPSDPTTVVVYLTYPFYADNDNDGYGAGAMVMLCSDAANHPPTGYAVNGTDCDDTKGDRHQTYPFYVDADGDSYGAAGSIPVQLCAVNATTPPVPNYSVNALDCNDLVAAIRPGVPEVAFDNIDNDCDGSLYNGLPQYYTFMMNNVCGETNQNLNATLNCYDFVLGTYVISYRFRITNLSTGEVSVLDRNVHHFKLTMTDIYSFGTSFKIEVALIINGEVQPYNPAACQVTTPTVQTTKVVPSQCGATLTYMYSSINATAVASTNLYRFRVVLASAPTTYYYIERTVPNFNLTQVVGLPLLYNTEYIVSVQIRVKVGTNIAWSQFGLPCSIFTPAPPTTSIIVTQCEMTASSNTQQINTAPVTGATAYRFLLTLFDVTGEIILYQQYVDNASPYFTLSQFTGLIPSTTYTVSVAPWMYGILVPYDKDCSITTPALAKTLNATNQFNASAYPNPFANNFRIDVKSSSQSIVNVKVYDMIGRLVEQRDVRVSDFESTTIGERYPSGIYNIVVAQENNIQTVRVIKR